MKLSEAASRTDVSAEKGGSPGGSRLLRLGRRRRLRGLRTRRGRLRLGQLQQQQRQRSAEKGGTLTFARTQDADVGLNPIKAPSNGSIFTIQQIFDQLVEVQGDQLVPGLATSWEHSADGKIWTFHLRDAQFSNGAPVTAEDVKFSLDRFADPEDQRQLHHAG